MHFELDFLALDDEVGVDLTDGERSQRGLGEACHAAMSSHWAWQYESSQACETALGEVWCLVGFGENGKENMAE